MPRGAAGAEFAGKSPQQVASHLPLAEQLHET
jgi:hypothetical protein